MPADQVRLALGAAAIAPRNPQLISSLAQAVAASGDVRLASHLASQFSQLTDATLVARLASLVDDNASIPLWRRAIALNSKPEWTRSLQLVRARLNAAQRNDARRPIVVAGTTQPHNVKSRITGESLVGVMEDEQ